jgi:hypothetical protein
MDESLGKIRGVKKNRVPIDNQKTEKSILKLVGKNCNWVHI